MYIRNPETQEWEPVYLPPTGDTLPIGMYGWFAGEKVPTGWLRCDGQAVSRTEYSDLFNAIGTTYGAGDGSTTFNLPNVNLANRTLVGSSGDGEFALGNTMGEKEHTLTINEIPSHAPIIMGSNVGGSDKAETVAYGGSANGTAMYATTPIGGGQSHNNMQPSIAAICIIKAKQSVGLVGTVTDDINDTNENAVANAKTIKNYVDEKNTYSTSEKVVGTWIDGKPIYRKIVDIGSLTNGTQKVVNHNINIETPIRCSGICYNPSASMIFTLPMETITIWLDVNQIVAYPKTDRTNTTAKAIIEYTKTTD